MKDLLNLLISQYKDQGLNKTNSLFTDKSISSFLYIELIVKIFPNAKFIYCYRDPLANILGLLRAFLPNILWSHSLDKTFNVFDFYYKKLEKIKKNKSIDIFQINLEKLTSNPQRISKDLYKFLDLKWNSNSLKINNNNFVIKTASNIQIKNHIIKHDLEYTSNYIKLFRDLGYEYSWLA